MAFAPAQMSDEELRRKLQSYGINAGPITDTTRQLYQSKLKKRMREGGDSDSGPSSAKRPKTEHTPSHQQVQRARKQKRGNSPRASQRQLRSRTPSPVPSAPPHPSLAIAFPSPLVSSSSQVIPSKPLPSASPASLGSDFVDGPSDIASSHPQSFSSGNLPSPASHQGLQFKRLSSSRGEGSGGLVSALSNTVQSGLQLLGELGDGMKKLVSPILKAASPRTQRSSQGHRHMRTPSRSVHPYPPSGSLRFDSVEIGGEMDDAEEGCDALLLEPGPTPSAPPPPPLPPPPPHSGYELNENKYDWELAPSDVQICVKPGGSRWRLGKGGFGEVFKGLKDGVDEVAVKVIHMQSQTTIAQFKSEIDMISKLRHRHIVQFYGACIKPPCLYMVTELMQTDLFSALRRDIRYEWTGIYGKQVAEGIASGLHYLHCRRPPVVHRDIKSPNILLMEGLAKIADVGVARTKASADMTAQRGFTIAWAAPEVVYRRRATEKIDIWSFGIIIWEIFTGRPPGPGHLVMPASASVRLRKLFTDCTSEDPALRPTAAAILLTLKDMM